ncbi:MAG: NAD(P)H-hydrate dehydratase [Acidobacteria bacterium]|nr:MAG: NAD(P)H-hydrate dehydratase [Acidobacteriota bacterium]
MHILTAAEMREADRRTIQDIGVPGRVLMESAGRGVAGAMEEHLPELADQRILIVCGKGNNGGDGLVLLRTLVGLGYEARAVVLSAFEDLGADALDNLQSAVKLNLPVDPAADEAAWRTALLEMRDADVIVDAILGTGLTKGAHGLPLRAIEDLSGLDAFKVAVDIPSGLSSDSGRLPGAVLEADLTIALAAPKVCHFVSPACEHCGTIEVVDIGIPPIFLQRSAPRLATIETIESGEVEPLWPARHASAHKGDFGHLLIVAGSVGKTGAAVMAAEAALRTGAGLVTVASAKSAVPMMAPQLPEAMWEPLEETATGAIAFGALDRLLELADARTAVAMGPGLGLHDDTVRLVLELLQKVTSPLVVDADGLNALKGAVDQLPSHVDLALTPHPGEASRLLGVETADIQEDRLRYVRELAMRTKAAVLLKGFRTLVSDADGNVKVNLTGNPGLASGGSGDVLTGIVGGLVGQGVPAFEALTLAAHVHGLAGDLAKNDVGETALVARDVLRTLPAAMRELGAD